MPRGVPPDQRVPVLPCWHSWCHKECWRWIRIAPLIRTSHRIGIHASQQSRASSICAPTGCVSSVLRGLARTNTCYSQEQSRQPSDHVLRGQCHAGPVVTHALAGRDHSGRSSQWPERQNCCHEEVERGPSRQLPDRCQQACRRYPAAHQQVDRRSARHRMDRPHRKSHSRHRLPGQLKLCRPRW